MGKQRRNRRKPHKENPTGLVSIKDCEDSEEEIADEDHDTAFQKAYDQVKSSKLEERLSALRTLESMCCEKDQAICIAKSGVTKIIAPFLVDPDTTLRAASASALRRIGESGGDEAYENLLQDDVMTPLTALLKKYYADWQPKTVEPGSKNRVNDERETLIEAVALLWSLCENSECAIKPSNESNLISLLLKFLDSATYGTSVSVVAAQCMLTLSEDNPSAIEELKQHESTVLSLLELRPQSERESCEIVPLRILAAGLLTNIYGDVTRDESQTSAIMCKVTSVINETLTIDHATIVIELASMLPTERKACLSRNAKTKLLAAKKILEAQQQALEILTNLCSEERRDDEADSELDDSDLAEDDNEIVDMDNDDEINDKSVKILSNLPVTLVEVIISSGLIKRVRDKTAAPEASIREELNAHPDSKCVDKLVHTLRCRAFICLNNLMASLDVDTLGGVDQIYRLWLEIGTTVFKDSDPTDIELLESATAAMRAAMQKLAEVRANTFEKLTIADIEPMLNGERQCSNPNVRANLIRIVGSLALILSESEKYSNLVKYVSVALLDICTRESEVWVMSEALDALMDIFAEDETDRVAGEIKLVDKLQPLVPVLINKIRQQRKTLGDNALVVSTVKTNLTRFIKYKKHRLAKIR